MVTETSLKSWGDLYEAIGRNALAGEDKVSYEFFLLDKVDPTIVSIETVKDMIDTSAEFFAIAHNMNIKEAKQVFLASLRYATGYYSDGTTELWREIISSYGEEAK